MVREQDQVKASEIGRRIAQARKEAGGMTQRELAELLGVTERSVIAYERGEVIPYRFMVKLESSLGKDAAWFLHGEAAIQVRDQQLDELMSAVKQLRAAVARLEKKGGG